MDLASNLLGCGRLGILAPGLALLLLTVVVDAVVAAAVSTATFIVVEIRAAEGAEALTLVLECPGRQFRL